MNSVVSLFHHGMDNFEMAMNILVPQKMVEYFYELSDRQLPNKYPAPWLQLVNSTAYKYKAHSHHACD